MSTHVPKQRKSRKARTGSTVMAKQAEAAKVEAFIQTIMRAPTLEAVLFVRDEFLYCMQWAELNGDQRVILDQARYSALNRALEQIPGFFYSLHGIVESILFSDAKSEIYNGNRTEATFDILRSYRNTSHKLANRWWWKICKKMNPAAHATFNQDTPREEIIRATLAGMDMEALQAFVAEHEIQIELVRGSNFKGLREQNQIILEHRQWIFSDVPDSAPDHPGQHPGWKDRAAGLAYERQLRRFKEESQWRRGFPSATLGGNTESTLALLRIIADNEQEFMDEIGTPWCSIKGGANLPKSLSSLFPTEANQAQQESA
jgi:hypothetical protein